MSSEPLKTDVSAVHEKEYIIICDESVQKDRFYSNFYGGVILAGSMWDPVNARLKQAFSEFKLHSEVKWSKVGPRELEPYKNLIRVFFDLMDEGALKMRVMFRHNVHHATELTPDHERTEYFILYYQFLKHCFGLQHMPEHPDGVKLRFYLDQLPDQSKEKKAQFKGFICGIEQNPRIRRKGLRIAEENVTEVNSKEHALLQCLDVVLGSIQFRMNDKHKFKPEGQSTRGKRTIAKEKLYKFILKEIKRVSGKPGFNPGISTGSPNGPIDRWENPYRHWRFVPNNHRYDSGFEK